MGVIFLLFSALLIRIQLSQIRVSFQIFTYEQQLNTLALSGPLCFKESFHTTTIDADQTVLISL